MGKQKVTQKDKIMLYQPKLIKRNGPNGLTIGWSDGTSSILDSALLRMGCPCAECKESRGDTTHAKPITGKKRSLRIIESSAAQQTELMEIWGVGQYALGMRWGDGHSSGIYTFAYLRELCENSSTIPHEPTAPR